MQLLTKHLDKVRDEAIIIQKKEEKKRLQRHNIEEPTEYSLGELVLVVPTQKPSKLQPRLLGPFKIVERPTDLVYRVQAVADPTRTMDLHASRLRPFKSRSDYTPEEFSRFLSIDDGELLVEAILGHTGSSKSDVRFHVRWAGYGEADDTDEPWPNVEGNTLVDAYLEAHPELKEALLTPKKKPAKKYK